MPSQTRPDDRLDGWEAISDYLGWHVRTVIRWEKLKGLPIHRVPGGKRQPVYAYRHEIDRWFQETGGSTSNLGSSLALSAEVESPIAVEVLVESPAKRRLSRLGMFTGFLAVFLLLFASGAAWRRAYPPPIQVIGLTQLSDDGREKAGLVTDGERLYFSEIIGTERVLSTMAVSGGPIRRVEGPQSPVPQDVSPNGKLLLVLSYEGHEEEHPLWIVPTAGGPPHPVNGVRCQAAAWSPDGKWIVYAFGNAIYLISSSGEQSRLLSRLDGPPETLRWSADGRHLMLLIRNSPTWGVSLWQLNLDRNFNASRAIPLRSEITNCCQVWALAGDGPTYFTASNDSAANRLLYVRPKAWWQRGLIRVTDLSTNFRWIGGLVSDRRARQLFVLSAARPQCDLMRFDRSTQTFTLFLAGISATFVDFAKNTNWITYVRSSDNTLWVSRSDGSDARQLSPAGMDVELPRWSPNGKRIAFMARQPDRPWRIFVVSAAEGNPKEASNSTDDQGAPTWSPDGRFLIYGNVYCQEEHTCAIHKINLATGDTEMLPNSEGLGTARWSPDGRHIAALNPERRELYVFEFDRSTWRRLMEDTNGNDVSWSADSQYVYTNRLTKAKTEILRVPVGGGNAQTVLNLASFNESAGHLGTWFSLTPDNSIVTNRWLNTSEIYALNYSER